MKLLIEIPDEQVYRGVPRQGFADYIERERAKAREESIREIRRAILFMTRLVPCDDITVVAEQVSQIGGDAA